MENGPEYWIRKILIKEKKGSNKEYITNKSIDVALVCNKIDIKAGPEKKSGFQSFNLDLENELNLQADSDQDEHNPNVRKVTQEMGLDLARKYKIGYFEVSAKEDVGIEHMFQSIYSRLEIL